MKIDTSNHKVRAPKFRGSILCADNQHEWGVIEGDVEIKEFPDTYHDIRAFIAAKTLWEWEHTYWLKRIGYAE